MSNAPLETAYDQKVRECGKLTGRIEELEREVERLNRIKSRTHQVELQSENDALLAHIAHLRKALKLIKYETDIRGNPLNKLIRQEAIEALAATPAQSLARIRNQRVEDVAVMVKNDGWLHLAEAIRTMKEPE